VKLPRDISGEELVRLLARLGYEPARRVGSHVRLTTAERGGHKITVPMHRDIRVGTLDEILERVAAHFGLTRPELAERLFGSEAAG
jgi:predicted RNA binding protein YcfA (HicA-like mRNA interferase family)